MGLFSGLEKFGFGGITDIDITAEEPKEKPKATETQPKQVVEKKETDFLLEKTIPCPVCGKDFKAKAVANTRLKRLEPDEDLRPNYEAIDTLKYDVIGCPHCGYTAMISTFAKIDSARIKLIRAEFCSQFKPQPEPQTETISYERAIEKYKLALICAMKKKGKLSEKAYICLKISWLRRAQLKRYEAVENADKQLIDNTRAEMDAFYKQAYDGFTKALSTETPPYCGMESSIVEYMLVCMGKYFGDYDNALKLASKLITNPATKSSMKDRLLNMKDEMMAAKGEK